MSPARKPGGGRAARGEASRRQREVETLAEVASTIASSRYIEEMLGLIVTMTAQLLGSSICSIMLYDERKKELFIAATQSLSHEYRSKPNIGAGHGISGRAFRIKKPLAVPDVGADPDFLFPGLAKREGLVSMLSVPMLVRDRAVGVINSYTSIRHVFGADEIRVLQAVANQAAVAIDNTRLLGRVSEMEESLESRKVVERAKGILMEEMGYTEAEAHRAIQKKSMEAQKSMREIARALITDREVRGR